MKVNYKFRQIPWSDELAELANCRFARLSKLEWSPMVAHVTFSAERHECRTEVRLSGSGIVIKAVSYAPSFIEGLDAVVAKLHRQMERKKGRIQNHLVYENTHHGKLDRQLPAREMPEVDLPPKVRKAG